MVPSIRPSFGSFDTKPKQIEKKNNINMEKISMMNGRIYPVVLTHTLDTCGCAEKLTKSKHNGKEIKSIVKMTKALGGIFYASYSFNLYR